MIETTPQFNIILTFNTKMVVPPKHPKMIIFSRKTLVVGELFTVKLLKVGRSAIHPPGASHIDVQSRIHVPSGTAHGGSTACARFFEKIHRKPQAFPSLCRG